MRARIVLVPLIAALAVGVVGCTDPAGDAPAESSVGLPAPVMQTPEELDGATVTIAGDRPLVIQVDDPTAWVGNADDESVAAFVPGSDDGSATFNPGVEAVGPGTTTVTIVGPDEHEITFTVVVE